MCSGAFPERAPALVKIGGGTTLPGSRCDWAGGGRSMYRGDNADEAEG